MRNLKDIFNYWLFAGITFCFFIHTETIKALFTLLSQY